MPLDLAAEEWASEQVTAKAICLKNAQDSTVPGPLTILRRLRLRSGEIVWARDYTVTAGISDGSIDFLKRR